MSGRSIEARLVVSAEDKATAVFNAIAATIDKLAKSGKNIDNLGKSFVSGARHVDAMGQSVERLDRRMGRLAQAGRAIDQVARKAAAIDLVGGGAVAFLAKRGAAAVKETYREFDKVYRATSAFGGLSRAQMEPLVNQAIRGGATTKYNDIQWLEAHKELAQRGIHDPQSIMGLAEVAANLGQAFDLPLKESVQLLEGALFGFQKDVSTFAKAVENAGRTADIQVKAAKSSGMSPDDIRELYKYGATPAHLAGLSEETLLAFGALGKKANIGGDEMGVAFRALTGKLLSPTAKGREALAALGLNYSDYQSLPKRLNTAGFISLIAQNYGVSLDEGARSKLDAAFSNPAVFGSSAFAAAVMDAVGGQTGASTASSKKKIAGAAERYRTNSRTGIDADRLFSDIMSRMAGNIALSNAYFGEKQGARIATALQNEARFNDLVSVLTGQKPGFAGDIAAERMSGFDGAVSRFEGAIKNFETSVGRANDGVLTGFYNVAGQSIQHLAELPPAITQFGTHVLAFGASVAAVRAATAALGLVGGGSALAGLLRFARFGTWGLVGGALWYGVSSVIEDWDKLHESKTADQLDMRGGYSPYTGAFSRRSAGNWGNANAPAVSIFPHPLDRFAPGRLLPLTGIGSGLHGDVKGEVTVTIKVEPGSGLLDVKAAADRAAAAVRGTLNANGPGSAGTSSPDAAPSLMPNVQ